MAVHEAPAPVKKPVGRPRKERLEPEPQTRLRAVLPENAKRVAKLPQRQKSTRVNINLRMPMELLVQYKLGGPGYQTRMIAVLQMFLDEDGEFVEEIMESP
jgi:uncharacterized protein (DUF4415 family)